MSSETKGELPSLIYLEDLYIGQQFWSLSYQIDERQIKEFATQFDPQPFHLDNQAAKDSFFGELVASGWHTSALTMRLLVTAPQQFAGGLIGLSGETCWPRPVRPGDLLKVRSEVLAISGSRPKNNRGLVTMRIETLNQNDEVVQKMVAKVLVLSSNP